MKRLFNDNDYTYTDEATQLDMEFSKYLEGIFTEYSEYSIRELSHLLILAVNFLECEFIMRERNQEGELTNIF